jgi:hypothetical protein
LKNKEISPAHEIFLRAIEGDPKNLNISHLARRTDIPLIKLWRYVNGRCGWRVDEWLLAMAGLNRLDLVADLIEEMVDKVKVA